jgi:hypothetical protein
VQGDKNIKLKCRFEDLRPPAPDSTYVKAEDWPQQLQFGDPVGVLFMGAWCPATAIRGHGGESPRVLLHGENNPLHV